MSGTEALNRAEVEALATCFATSHEAGSLLLAAGYPPAALPASAETARSYWERVAAAVAAGVMQDGRRRIIAEAFNSYPYNPAFQYAPAPLRPDSSTATTSHSANHASSSSTQPSAKPGALRVLLLGASPDDEDRVRWDAELKAMSRAADRGFFVLDVCPAATARDLKRIRTFRPDLLHLACHGEGEFLVFETMDGEAHKISASDIVATLRLAQEQTGVRLRSVLLRSCGSSQVADAFTEVAETVIAHQGALNDRCAAEFTSHFYEELASIHDPAPRDFVTAARLAAQDTVNQDQYCRSVLNGLVIRPAMP